MTAALSRRHFMRTALAGGSVIAAGSARSSIVTAQNGILFHPEWVNNFLRNAALSQMDASLVTPIRLGTLDGGGGPSYFNRLDPSAQYFNHYMAMMQQLRAAGLDRLMSRVADHPEIWPQLHAGGMVDWGLIDQGLTPYFSAQSKAAVIDQLAYSVNLWRGWEAGTLRTLRDSIGFVNLHNANAAAVLRGYADRLGQVAQFPCYNPPWWNEAENWWWYDPFDTNYTPQPQSFLQMTRQDFCFYTSWAQFYATVVVAVLTRGPSLGLSSTLGIGTIVGAGGVVTIGPGIAALIAVGFLGFTAFRMIYC